MAATDRQGEAITKHDRSMVVTAGAGTGKTYVLVQKYIDMIRTQGVSVPQILALTFTDKAAAEMKDRIRSEILRQAGPQWAKAAEDFMIAPVQTFHSFCVQILREFPIEAGLEPDFVVLDEQQVSRIHGQAYEDLIHTRHSGPLNDALVHVLSILDQNPLRTMLTIMYGKREQFSRFFAALGDDEDQVISVWKAEIDGFRDAEIAALRDNAHFRSCIRTLNGLASAYAGVDDKAVIFLQSICPLLSRLETPVDAGDFCRAALEVQEKKPGNIGSKKVWKASDLESFKNSRKDLVEHLERKKSLFLMTVDPIDPIIIGSVQFLHALSTVFSWYNERVGKGKAAVGGLDFSDLLLHARKFFLNQRELVAVHIMPRFRYILVDEFQDTDQIQFEIILTIIGTPSAATDRIFIVGDPKQSIYLFRDADVTLFKKAQELISVACKGRVVSLDTSFRSSRDVIGLSNFLFSRLMVSSEKPWEFDYDPVKLSASRSDQSGLIELLLPLKGTDTIETKRNEAVMVARRIHSIVNAQPLFVHEEGPDHAFARRQARYGDIAILLEQRTNLSYYLAKLGEYGIPFHVHGGIGFYQRQEVYDLCNILSFLEHRHDVISLAGILRSPYFGVPDTELLSIAREKGRTLWDKLGTYAERTGPGPATRARALLASWQMYAGRVSLVSLLRRILAESGVYSIYAALPAGDQILSNIEKLVSMARNREEVGSYALADFTADLRMAIEENEREGEASRDTLAENAVNIMTVHAAKGLEFPIVFVPDMGMVFKDRHPPIMIGDNPLLVGLKVPNPAVNYEMAESAVMLMLRELQRQKERAEKKRLLYVALTRARDHLFMSGTLPDEQGLSLDLGRSRIDWMFTALGITGCAISEGGLALPEGLRVGIVSDPLTIPAETVRVSPSLIVVPPDCSSQPGTWTPLEYSVGLTHVRPVSVSELEMKDKPTPHVGTPGVSKYLPDVAWITRGTIIHEVLRGRDAATVLSEYGEYSEEHVQQCVEICTIFFSSDIMKRVKCSYCEVPFAVMIDGQPVTGRIDRLCEMDDGTWIVIDYKSEVVSPQEYVLCVNNYARSMTAYSDAARQIVDDEIKGFLYFTETAEFCRTGV